MQPDLPEYRCALEAIAHWTDRDQLAEMAVGRHGFGDSNGGFGVTYPTDIDEHDREVEGAYIPENCVEVYSFWGPPDGYKYHISELTYLNLLEQVLRLERNQRASQRVQGIEQELRRGMFH